MAKYIIENEDGTWLGAHFDKESAKKQIEYQKRNDAKKGQKHSYRIKTPDKLRYGKTKFPQDTAKIKWNAKPDDLVVVETNLGSITKGKVIKSNVVLLRKQAPKYIKSHGVVVTGIHHWDNKLPAATPKKK